MYAMYIHPWFQYAAWENKNWSNIWTNELKDKKTEKFNGNKYVTLSFFSDQYFIVMKFAINLSSGFVVMSLLYP